MNNIEIQWVEEAFGELSNKTMSDVFKLISESHGEDIIDIIKEGLKAKNPDITDWSF